MGKLLIGLAITCGLVFSQNFPGGPIIGGPTSSSSSGAVFGGATAVTQAFSATPTFSLANVSSKSPVRFEPAAMTAAVTSVTFTSPSAGAKFSIVWLQDGTGGRTLTHAGSALNTCETAISLIASKYTEQFYEVAADGTTIYGVGCPSNDPGFPVTTLTDAATITWAIGSLHDAVATVTLGGNRTLNITNPVITGNYVLKVIQDGTGTRTLTPGTGCTWLVLGGTGGGTFAISTAASAKDILAFYYDGTSCFVTVGKAYAAP